MSTPMLIAVFTALLFFVLSSLWWLGPSKSKGLKLQERLGNVGEARIDEILREDDVVSDTFYGRRIYAPYIRPRFRTNPSLLEQLSKALGFDADVLNSRIRYAGLEKTITAEEILSMKAVGLAGAFLGLGLGFLFGSFTLMMAGALAYLLGVMAPQRSVETKVKQKREAIMRALPDFLDLLRAVVEAGMALQEAIGEVSSRTTGPIAEEFRLVAAETKMMGGDWKKAMENMAFRNDIDDLSDVISDILISFDRGTEVADTLEKEAIQMRALRTAKVQEQARSMSVRLLLPMAVFIFFPIVLLMLVPMLIQITQQMQ